MTFLHELKRLMDADFVMPSMLEPLPDCDFDCGETFHKQRKSYAMLRDAQEGK